MGNHNKLKYISKILLILIPALLSVTAYAQGEYVEGEIIVKLRDQVSQNESYTFMGKAAGSRGMVLKKALPKMRMYHYGLRKGQSVEESIEELKSDPSVEYAEPNYFLKKASVSEVEALSTEEFQSLMEDSGGRLLQTEANIQTDGIEDRFYGEESDYGDRTPASIVAVIDTGVDVEHKAFRSINAIWTNPGEIPGNQKDDDGNGYIDDVQGWDFLNDSGEMGDDDGHGTHVSGIILGVGRNLMSENTSPSLVQVMPLKFLDKDGVGSTSDAIAAIYYAIENGARVINNSWGGPYYSAALHEAIYYSYQKGVVFVAAAGNSGQDNDNQPLYPASYDLPHVIAVAATTDSDDLAPFSNFGAGSVDLGSPGVFILSTVPDNGYGYSSGTSMATPFVSGVAALMLVEAPTMKGYQIKTLIFDESDRLEILQSKLTQESRINVEGPVLLAAQVPVDKSQPEYSFTAADREVASLSFGVTGCGLVGQMYNKFRGGGGGGGAGFLSSILFLSIMSLPLLVVHYLRRREGVTKKRKHDRFKVESDIRVQVGDSCIVGSVKTISLGGLQVNTEALLEEGGIVTMTVSSPDGKEQIQVEGAVVWSKEQEAYGVQFAKEENEFFKFFTGWAKSMVKEGS